MYLIDEPWNTPSWSVPLARSKGESARPDLWPDYAMVFELGVTPPTSYPELNGRFVGSRVYTTSSFEIKSGRLGLYFAATTDNENVVLKDIPFGGTKPISIVSLAQVYDYGIYCFASQSNEIILRTNTATNGLEFILNSFSSNDRAIGTISAGAVSGIHLYSGTYNGQEISVYLDSKKLASSVPSGTYADDAGNFIVGARNGVSDWFKGWIHYVLIYEKGLSHSQIAQLSADPYCWLRPRRAMFKAAAAGAFKPYWARNSNVIIQPWAGM